MSALQIGRLQVQIDPPAPGRPTVVTLVGRLDDFVPLGELAARLPPGDVLIDTAGVPFVNSAGMREWVRLLRVLRDRGTVSLIRLADVLMVHMNVLAECKGMARIVSFYATYACDACGYEGALLVEAVANHDALRALRPPRLPCPECGAPAELADFPERYLMIFR
ncbi:MAG TPA: hypothetical protein VGC42_30940 [Kofleriaceae bacterium]